MLPGAEIVIKRDIDLIKNADLPTKTNFSNLIPYQRSSLTHATNFDIMEVQDIIINIALQPG